MKIVIADYSVLLRDHLKSSLMTVNNVEIVGEAENGIAALELIRDTDPDLAILEIRMPKLNGIEALRKIKESGCRTKVCILSSYPYPQYKERCLAEGADYFFNKSSEFEKAIEVIENLAGTETH